jgi:hypothetical protein
MNTILISYRQKYSFRERALLWLLGNVVPAHAKVYSRRSIWGLTREDMLRYTAGTLGHELVRWSRLGAQKQDVYFLSHGHEKQQKHAGQTAQIR